METFKHVHWKLSWTQKEDLSNSNLSCTYTKIMVVHDHLSMIS